VGSSTWSQTFDLSALASHADRARRFRLGLNRAQFALGLALVVIGGYFFFAPPPASTPRYSVGPALFIAIGIVLAAVAAWVHTGLTASPRRLVISNKGLLFDNIPGRKSLHVEWERPRLKLDLYDMREIRRVNPKSRSRGYDFLIQAGGGPETAIPQEAFDAIIRTAAENRLAVSSRKVPSGAGPPMVLTTIRPAH
jgi:hypothetical protein